VGIVHIRLKGWNEGRSWHDYEVGTVYVDGTNAFIVHDRGWVELDTYKNNCEAGTKLRHLLNDRKQNNEDIEDIIIEVADDWSNPNQNNRPFLSWTTTKPRVLTEDEKAALPDFGAF
jgi:hypothetical protein